MVREGRQRADALRYELKLGDAPVRDLFGFIEREFPGVLVIRYPMPDGPEGALLKYGDRWLIVVNTAEQYLARQRFTAAHELAHLQFDADGSPVVIDEDLYSRRPAETRANAFAVHFLLPADALRSRVAEADFDLDDDDDVVRLAMEYGLSIQSLSWHLMNVCGIPRRRQAEISRLSPYRIAARLGLADRVSREVEARDAVGWPARYTALVARAFEAGELSDDDLLQFLERPALASSLRTALDAG